jgi:protein ImuA
MVELDGRQARLEALRQQIAKAQSFSARSDEQLLLGVAEVDACLNGGLARGALHEIAAADHRSIPAALGFLLALSSPAYGKGADPKTRRRGIILWPLAKQASPFGIPYAPGLRFFGLDPSRIVFVRCASARDCVWVMEEGLRLGGVAAVIGARTKAMDLTASRRLQLAAEQAVTPVFLLRNHSDAAPSATVTRWRIAPAPSARDEFGFTKSARFHVALEYARGGKMGEWVMEWNSDALSLRLSSALGDRAAGEIRAA